MRKETRHFSAEEFIHFPCIGHVTGYPSFCPARCRSCHSMTIHASSYLPPLTGEAPFTSRTW